MSELASLTVQQCDPTEVDIHGTDARAVDHCEPDDSEDTGDQGATTTEFAEPPVAVLPWQISHCDDFCELWINAERAKILLLEQNRDINGEAIKQAKDKYRKLVRTIEQSPPEPIRNASELRPLVGFSASLMQKVARFRGKFPHFSALSDGDAAWARPIMACDPYQLLLSLRSTASCLVGRYTERTPTHDIEEAIEFLWGLKDWLKSQSSSIDGGTAVMADSSDSRLSHGNISEILDNTTGDNEGMDASGNLIEDIIAAVEHGDTSRDASTVEAKMFAIITKGDDTVIDWSAKRWADELECSESAIKKKSNKAWAAIQKLREDKKNSRNRTVTTLVTE